MSRKYKRHFTGSDNRARSVGQGKGHDRREAQVAEQQVARNWCLTFGHKRWDYAVQMCLDCGMTQEEGARPYHPPDCPHPRCNPPF